MTESDAHRLPTTSSASPANGLFTEPIRAAKGRRPAVRRDSARPRRRGVNRDLYSPYTEASAPAARWTAGGACCLPSFRCLSARARFAVARLAGGGTCCPPCYSGPVWMTVCAARPPLAPHPLTEFPRVFVTVPSRICSSLTSSTHPPHALTRPAASRPRLASTCESLNSNYID